MAVVEFEIDCFGRLFWTFLEASSQAKVQQTGVQADWFISDDSSHSACMADIRSRPSGTQGHAVTIGSVMFNDGLHGENTHDTG